MSVIIDNIPIGDSPEEIEKRNSIIWDFYQQWKIENPNQRVYNQHLRDYINIRKISIEETARHASKRYLSTLAVLQLEAILACAKLIRISKIKNRSNQKEFQACLSCNTNVQGLALLNY